MRFHLTWSCLIWCMFLSVFVSVGNGQIVESCDSVIFCEGRILDTVARAHIFNDSIEFVKMSLKFDAEVVIEHFDDLPGAPGNISKETLRKFVDDNFEEPSQAFEDWNPSDWVENPEFLDNVHNTEYRAFARKIHNVWPDLGRKVGSNVSDNAARYSIIWVPHGVIVPGGRFEEYYYWDVYFTIRGLLVSGMVNTTRGMIENLIHLVDEFGKVPNGGRIYYLGRSQPPMLIPSVSLYMDYLGTNEDSIAYLSSVIDSLRNEFEFWMETHIVEITENTQTYRLARYKSEEDVPRPESYYEDVTVAEEFPENERAKIYQEIRGACESGWDFSSRWFADPNGSQGLGTLVTSSIIPVDLNSLLCRNAATLAAMYKLLGDNENATHYEELHEEFRNAIENLLWDEEQGTWFDYDLESKSRRPSFYLSMAFPLWTDCVVDPASKMNRSLQYLQLNDSVLNSPGGVPISLNPTGQQWDYPNAWAPAVLVLIEALEGGNDTAADVAEKLAQVWVRTIYTAYQNYEALFEKYNVTELGAIGSGGEYSVQEGFGWTNGVLLSLFQQYGETLSPDSENGGSGGSVST